MSTILKNIVRFTGLVIGVPVALPHRLNVNGVPALPRTVEPNTGGFTITANTSNVIVTRTADGAASVDVLVEYWHSIEAVVPLVPPPGELAGLVPWVQQPGAGGGSLSQPSWIAMINAVSVDASTPTEWVQFPAPFAADWQPGDVITIDFQIRAQGASMSLFLAQGDTLIPTSPIINGTSANPWTGRMTFTVVAPAEGRMWGAMSTDDGGINIETNVPSPPASFSFTGSDPIRLLILSSVEATPLVGTLEARLSRNATITVVVG